MTPKNSSPSTLPQQPLVSVLNCDIYLLIIILANLHVTQTFSQREHASSQLQLASQLVANLNDTRHPPLKSLLQQHSRFNWIEYIKLPIHPLRILPNMNILLFIQQAHRIIRDSLKFTTFWQNIIQINDAFDKIAVNFLLSFVCNMIKRHILFAHAIIYNLAMYG